MAITVTEDLESPSLVVSKDNSSVKRNCTVAGTDDALLASAALEAFITALYYGLIFQQYTLDYMGGGTWRSVITYGKQEHMQPASSTSGPGGSSGPGAPKSGAFSFDTTGGTVKITHSLQTVNQYRRIFDPTPTDYHQALNIGADGKIEGIEVAIPQFSCVIQRKIAHPMSSSYVTDLYLKTGCVNSDTVVIVYSGVVLPFAPGELMYLGATGQQSGVEEWDISLKFAGSPNITGLSIGTTPNIIENIAKKGWEYLQVFTEQVRDGTNPNLVSIPTQVNIERIGRTAVLSTLLL